MARTSDTRENVLDFIRTFRRDNGYSPTVREIALHCGIKSTSVVQYHLNHLEKRYGTARMQEGKVEVAIGLMVAAGVCKPSQFADVLEEWLRLKEIEDQRKAGMI